MLLLHQTGSVKIGEVVRYTVSYAPDRDRILPTPEHLHLRIRNTSPIPLRAAFVHGPYTLSVAAYPSHYDPNTKFENPRRYGMPEFEPMLKAGGTWNCLLTVPDHLRQSPATAAADRDFGANRGPPGEFASWVIEIASQVIFSGSAAVGYEVLLARDEKSLNLGGNYVVGGNQSSMGQPGKLTDFQQHANLPKDGQLLQQLQSHHPKGVFSKALGLKVDDTASLWNTPQLPGWRDWDHGRARKPVEDDPQGPAKQPSANPSANPSQADEAPQPSTPQKTKKIHLVVLTHGLHSNLCADMLYMKESIDATVRQAKIDAKNRKARERAERTKTEGTQKDAGAQHGSDPGGPAEEDDGEDDEEVIVRGFSGNATRTERGIKFLGKRLARFVLSMTYPDQPFLPLTKNTHGISTAFRGDDGREVKDDSTTKASHKHSHIHMLHPEHHHDETRSFQITSISFIGHSLGGLIQTYAIAYIQKHSPQFFSLIKPINFITLASPLLGLSNENPLYVKFGLDFGLVGRTGQDLGLTWRAPTLARSGWGALVGTLGESAHKRVIGEHQPESKPLLRILPTGPAHIALKKFRNRTLYSNVVNDGIVPLRTSCLLFLDWQGLGRVEKARREAGLVETVLSFGWAELTGANTGARRAKYVPASDDGRSLAEAAPIDSPEDNTPEDQDSREVPLPAMNATAEDDRRSLNLARPAASFHEGDGINSQSQTNNDYPLSGFFNFFRSSHEPNAPKVPPAQKTPPRSPRETKIYSRSQTLKNEQWGGTDSANSSQSKVSAGNEEADYFEDGVAAPPRTTVFEAAGDLLNPVLPSAEYILDPSRRPRVIFHDRVYHPSDIPPPPLKKRTPSSLSVRRVGRSRTSSHSNALNPPIDSKSGTSTPVRGSSPSASQSKSGEDTSPVTPNTSNGEQTLIQPGHDGEFDEAVDTSNMKVEEKIARAYHRDLSWRKVLVKLEPDAHNNIIVRRMFANAHGWPVVKHLCDAHFSDSAAARTRDEFEQGVEQAKPMSEAPDKTGAETDTQKKGLPGDHRRILRRGLSGDAQDTDSDDDRPAPHEPLEHRTSIPSSIELVEEAEDKVADLPSSVPSRERSVLGRGGGGSLHLPTVDTTAWSDRDFADSADESEWDGDMSVGGGWSPHQQHHHHQEPNQASNANGNASKSPVSPVWNWTEKIVGRKTSESRIKDNNNKDSANHEASSSTSSPISSQQQQQQHEQLQQQQ